MSQASPSAPARPRSPLRQTVLITLAAVAAYVGVRQLPTGTNLSHTDFRVEGGTSIEFCDPSNPQFIPVVAVRSPVSMTVTTLGASPRQGAEVQGIARLATSSGKPIAPEDLLVTHTQRLHLLVLDPDLRDYQHLHPQPGREPGSWTFSFTPRKHGTYRVFADFTPAATARGLYASADLPVSAGEAGTPGATVAISGSADTAPGVAGIHFLLTPRDRPVRARSVTDFRFTAARADGEPVRLEPVMDAYAHLVAVDAERSGFAHLHPTELAPLVATDAKDATLNFKVTIPKAGRYAIWAQVRINGAEVYVPFWFDVVEG